MDLIGRPDYIEVSLPMSAEMMRNLVVLESACIVVFDRRASHRAIELMFQRYLMTEEPIKVASLIWEHKTYLVTFPTVSMARTITDSGPESFEGFHFYSQKWTPEWDAVSVDAHLAVWVEIGKLPAHFFDMSTALFITNSFGHIIKFSSNFFRKDHLESFAILLAVPLTRFILKTIGVIDGVLKFNISLKTVSVSAVAANVHLEEVRWEFLSRGERYHRAGLFDRPWSSPIDPYMAGFPEGGLGFCDHCHLNRRYCSIGNRLPPLTIISDSSAETQNRNETQENGEDVNMPERESEVVVLANGHASPRSVEGRNNMDSPPVAFRALVGGIHEEQLAELYGSLSGRRQRSSISLRMNPHPLDTPHSPIVAARFSSRISREGGETSSRSRPPGFFC